MGLTCRPALCIAVASSLFALVVLASSAPSKAPQALLYASEQGGVLDLEWDTSHIHLKQQLEQLGMEVILAEDGQPNFKRYPDAKVYVIPAQSGQVFYSSAEDTAKLHDFVEGGGVVVVMDSVQTTADATSQKDLISAALGYRGDWEQCEMLFQSDTLGPGLATTEPLADMHVRSFLPHKLGSLPWPLELEEEVGVLIHSLCKHQDAGFNTWPLYAVSDGQRHDAAYAAQAFGRIGTPGAVVWLGYSWREGPQPGWGALLAKVIGDFVAGDVYKTPTTANGHLHNWEVGVQYVTDVMRRVLIGAESVFEGLPRMLIDVAPSYPPTYSSSPPPPSTHPSPKPSSHPPPKPSSHPPPTPPTPSSEPPVSSPLPSGTPTSPPPPSSEPPTSSPPPTGTPTSSPPPTGTPTSSPPPTETPTSSPPPPSTEPPTSSPPTTSPSPTPSTSPKPSPTPPPSATPVPQGPVSINARVLVAGPLQNCKIGLGDAASAQSDADGKFTFMYDSTTCPILQVESCLDAKTNTQAYGGSAWSLLAQEGRTLIISPFTALVAALDNACGVKEEVFLQDLERFVSAFGPITSSYGPNGKDGTGADILSYDYVLYSQEIKPPSAQAILLRTFNGLLSGNLKNVAAFYSNDKDFKAKGLKAEFALQIAQEVLAQVVDAVAPAQVSLDDGALRKIFKSAFEDIVREQSSSGRRRLLATYDEIQAQVNALVAALAASNSAIAKAMASLIDAVKAGRVLTEADLLAAMNAADAAIAAQSGPMADAASKLGSGELSADAFAKQMAALNPAPGTDSPVTGNPQAGEEPSSPPPPSPGASAPSPSGGEAGGLSGGAIAGIVIGVVVGTILIVAIAFFIYRRRQQTIAPRDTSHPPAEPGVADNGAAKAVAV